MAKLISSSRVEIGGSRRILGGVRFTGFLIDLGDKVWLPDRKPVTVTE